MGGEPLGAHGNPWAIYPGLVKKGVHDWLDDFKIGFQTNINKTRKNDNKVVIFKKIEVFPVSRVSLGHFQNGFSPKAVQPEAPGFRGDPKTNLEARRQIWRYLEMK